MGIGIIDHNLPSCSYAVMCLGQTEVWSGKETGIELSFREVTVAVRYTTQGTGVLSNFSQRPFTDLRCTRLVPLVIWYRTFSVVSRQLRVLP